MPINKRFLSNTELSAIKRVAFAKLKLLKPEHRLSASEYTKSYFKFYNDGYTSVLDPTRFVGGQEDVQISSHRFGPSEKFHKKVEKYQKAVRDELSKIFPDRSMVEDLFKSRVMKYSGPMMLVTTINKKYFVDAPTKLDQSNEVGEI